MVSINIYLSFIHIQSILVLKTQIDCVTKVLVMRSDIKSFDGKVIDRISILFHRKVEFLLTNEYIMILI